MLPTTNEASVTQRLSQRAVSISGRYGRMSPK